MTNETTAADDSGAAAQRDGGLKAVDTKILMICGLDVDGFCRVRCKTCNLRYLVNREHCSPKLWNAVSHML